MRYDHDNAEPDTELVRQVEAGNHHAYGTLYARHLSAATATALRLSRSRPDAEDLVSEAFSRILATSRTRRDPIRNFHAYLHTTLRHLAYDRTRRERRTVLVDDMAHLIDHDTPSPENAQAVADEHARLAKSFAELPARWRAILWLIDIEGQRPADIAPRLGASPNAISALAYRARSGLRRALGSATGDTDRPPAVRQA